MLAVFDRTLGLVKVSGDEGGDSGQNVVFMWSFCERGSVKYGHWGKVF
jgi:hypothetical protein